jgi:hypothetical protein
LLRATNGLYEIRKVLHEIEKSGGGFLLLPRQSGPGGRVPTAKRRPYGSTVAHYPTQDGSTASPSTLAHVDGPGSCWSSKDEDLERRGP